MNAKFLRLNTKDFIEGLIVAVLAALLTGFGGILSSGGLPTLIQLKVIGLTAIAGGASYIVKSLLTNSQDKFLAGEPKVPPEVLTPPV